MEEIIDRDEAIDVAEQMIKHGGHFVAALGLAIFHADPINQYIIKKAFPNYWIGYKAMKIKGGEKSDK